MTAVVLERDMVFHHCDFEAQTSTSWIFFFWILSSQFCFISSWIVRGCEIDARGVLALGDESCESCAVGVVIEMVKC